MITLLCEAASRGTCREGGVLSRYGFSFGAHYDPAHDGYGSLRVVNEHVLAPGSGFDEERRANMEIVTWVVSGRLAHHDSVNGDCELVAGELLYLGAGSGLRHAERNDYDAAPAHFYELWIQPDRVNLAPRVARRRFSVASRRGRLCPIACPEATDQALGIAQDVRVYASLLETGETLDARLSTDRAAFIQIVSGEIAIGDQRAAAGDSLLVVEEERVDLRALGPAEVLWVGLPAANITALHHGATDN